MTKHLSAVLFVLLFAAASAADAETLVEHSNETRFQLDLAVPQAALEKYFPAGWKSNIGTTGPAARCNLRVIFVDRVTVNDPSGAAKASNRFVILAAPVTNPAGENVHLVIGGIAQKLDDAVAPFGNFLQAAKWEQERSIEIEDQDLMIESQEWDLEAATGERFQMDITFQRGVSNRRPVADVLYYSAKNPSFYHISRQEQVLDIMRNATTNPPDHVMEFSFEGSGGTYADLFDDTVEVLSWDNVLWLNREILLP